MNNLIIRISALILHALVNIFIVTFITDFDISGSWLHFMGFIIILFILLIFFIRHILSFIHFIKQL